jgi:xanthine dehydrogenase accessory factor
MGKQTMNFFEAAQALTSQNISFAVATLFAHRGHVPQDPGAKMIVTVDGLHFGTVGGGKIEMAAIKKCQAILESHREREPEMLKWNLQTDLGMSCGGEATFLFEHFIGIKWPIAIFGAGHVAQALINILKPLNCQITCIDSRQDWIDKVVGVKTICTSSPKEIIHAMDPKTFYVTVTMGHDHDFPVLLEIFRSNPDCLYVGCIGSEIKGKKIKKQLGEAGVTAEFIQKIQLPMGLPIGTNHPQEVAISIAAQLLQVRDKL